MPQRSNTWLRNPVYGMTSQNASLNAKVADAATQEQALPLDGLALIGTFLKPTGAKALLRQGNRIKQVTMGGKIAGHTVTAIEDSQILLARNGLTQALRVAGQ